MKPRSQKPSACHPLAAFLLLPLLVGLAVSPATGADRTPVITYDFDDAPSGSSAPAPAPAPAPAATTPDASVTGYGKNPISGAGNNSASNYGTSPVVTYGDSGQGTYSGGKPYGKPLIPPPGVNSYKFHFGLDTTVLYDDNIYTSHDGEVEDIVFRITPHIGIDMGDVDGLVESYGILRYSPGFNFYNENDAENTIDQDASFEGQLRFGRLAILGFSRYQASNDAQPEGGERYNEEIFTNAGRLVYNVSPKTNVEVGAKNIITDHSGDDDLIDSTEWIYDVVGEYVVSDKTRIGLGYAYGTLDVEGASADQTYNRPFGRFLWYPSGKVSLEAIAGVDFRELPIGDRDTFVYDVSLQYNPRAGTAMHFGTYRDIEPSVFFADQNYTSTGVNFKIDQRVGTRWFAGLDVGYEWNDYYAVDSTPFTSREDEYYYIRPSMTYAFRDWIDIVFWYRYRANESPVEEFDYDNNQLGVSMNVVF